jgi:hypothetical protein
MQTNPFQSADLELVARNEREIDTRCRTIARQLRASFDNLANQQAKANADWHDDQESEDHARYHAPAIEQFPPDVRNAAIIKVIAYHLRELDIEREYNASK